jgi:DNA helicase IV
MAFELPDYSSLNPQQVDMINLPTSRNFMIKGSPGTGKTVVAIYRAAQMRNKKVLMLVYNRPLMLYLKSAIEDMNLSNCTVNTYHSWMTEFYREKFGKSVPKIDRYEHDWSEVLSDCKNIKPSYDHVIIDEAQDFPKELLSILTKVAKNITCFIDSNQAIEADKTDVVDAIEKLCIEAPFTLEFNYRNTKEIAAVSKLYWHQDGRFAKARRIGNRLPTMVHCVDYDDQTEAICDIIRDHKDATIGVFVNNKSLNLTYDNLSYELEGEVEVEMFKAMGHNNIDFNTSGVKILSYGTMKGLEFDIVILAAFDRVRTTGDPVANQNRAYVATSRARDDLYICYFDTRCNTIKWVDTMSAINGNRHLFQWA